jgi:N-acetylneuraminic acid mutarotase
MALPLSLLVGSCGGGGGGGNGTASFAIVVGVAGLQGSKGLVLQDNGADNLAVSADGTFKFAVQIASGSTYSITVMTNPAGKKCSVIGSSGTVGSADVTGIAVQCLAGAWTWMNGSRIQGAKGLYAAIGAVSDVTVPGARQAASSWTDQAGDFWTFGGFGADSAGSLGSLNDLWNYCSCSGVRTWKWVKGSNRVNAAGVYGTLGTAASGNSPGARQAAITWTDAYGNFWLFGGIGLDAGGSQGSLNDLWKFDPNLGNWTWINGPSTISIPASYGTLNTGAPTNLPGARQGAAAWSDASSNLWMFGGDGYDSAGTQGHLNDLWEFDTAGNGWIWRGGSNVAGAAGVYGTLASASGGNVPGARLGTSAWADSAGNFWLFGGLGIDLAGSAGELGDLWEFKPQAGTWTWQGGPSVVNGTGNYPALGAASASAVPGARQGASAWIDAAGNLWLFGGSGFAVAGPLGVLNDLWKFSPASGQWTWVGGSNLAGAGGNYGTIGIVAMGNVPGARSMAPTWIDGAGNLWLLGGYGNASGGVGVLGDLWEYTP